MSTSARFATFAELSLADSEEAGGKGANLGELVSAGLPVPSGFVLLRDGYRDSMRAAGVDAQLAALHRDALAAASEPDTLDELSGRLQDLVAGAGSPTTCAPRFSRPTTSSGRTTLWPCVPRPPERTAGMPRSPG